MASLLESLRNFGNSNTGAGEPQGYSSLGQFGNDQSPSLYNLAQAEKAKQSEQKAMENTVDSALRGHVFNQDQNLVNKDMGYSPAQLKILDALKSYAVTGTKSR